MQYFRLYSHICHAMNLATIQLCLQDVNNKTNDVRKIVKKQYEDICTPSG